MDKILVTRPSIPPYEEYIEEIKTIWETRWLTNMGPIHNKLEKKLLDYLDVDNITLFANGHLALELGLQAMNLKGEVITTPFTFASTTHAIVRNGLEPVFCDIRNDNFTIDSDKIEELITDKTSAIVPVHVYGSVCDIDSIEQIANKYGLKVIYDAAHTFGVRYKGRGICNYGDASMLSFHATKVYNTIEGGAMCYHSLTYGDELRKLRDFGIKNEEIVDGVGSNAKMTEFSAAMGVCNLRHINDNIESRKKIVELYRSELANVDGITMLPIQKNVESNYAYFPIIIDEKLYGFSRNELYEELMNHNIFTRKYFYPLTSSFDSYFGRFDPSKTPIALHISKRILTLPLYADLKEEEALKVTDTIRKMK